MPCVPAEVDEDARAEPAELLPLPVAEGVEALQDEDDDPDGQLPVGVLLLAHNTPHGHCHQKKEITSGHEN